MSVHENHPGLMELTDGHMFEAWPKMDTHSGSQEGPDTRSSSFTELAPNPVEPKVVTPYPAPPHPIDLTTSSEHHYVESFGPKTPLSHGEVPEYVMVRIRDEECPPPPPPPTPQLMDKNPASASKVCLERRFNTIAPKPVKILDLHSAYIDKILSKLHETDPQPERQTIDTGNVYEASNPSTEGAFNQAHTYMVVPNNHQQGPLYPNNLAFNLYQERHHPQIHHSSNTGGEYAVAAASISRESSNAHVSKPIRSKKENKMSARGSWQEGSRKKPMSASKRKEMHNSKERERRRKITLAHKQLNVLVPFCNEDTDKVTTLQWTTAYLEYINHTYGEVFKEEFTALASKITVCPAATCPAGTMPNKEEVDNNYNEHISSLQAL